MRQFPGPCRREQDSETRWSSRACLSAPPAPQLLTSPPCWLPTAVGHNQLQAGFGPGLWQHGMNRDGSRRERALGTSWGAAALVLPTSKGTAGCGESFPHRRARTCPPPSSPPWLLQGLPAHGQERRALPQPTTAESSTRAHAPVSAFDCNTAVTDFPLLLTWVFLLCLSLPFLLSPITSPLPIPLLLPGTGREDGNTRSSARDLPETWVQSFTNQTPNRVTQDQPGLPRAACPWPQEQHRSPQGSPGGHPGWPAQTPGTTHVGMSTRVAVSHSS